MIIRFLWYAIPPYLPFLVIGLLLYWMFRVKENNWVKRKPSRIARISEALVLLFMGSIVLALSCTDAKNGGLLGNMKDIPLSYLRYHIIAVVAVALACMFGVLLSTFGRTSRGIILVALSLAFYGWLINGPGNPHLTCHVPRQYEYVIGINGYEHVSADLWINDVYLGKTPVTILEEEFYDRVPIWTTPPPGFDQAGNSRISPDKRGLIEYTEYGPKTINNRLWWPLDIRRKVLFHDSKTTKTPRIGEHLGTERYKKSFFARVQYNSEDGYVSQGESGSDGTQFSPQYRSFIHVVFPQLNQRLETLLDIARLNGYSENTEWYQAIETYGDDGWIKLREAGKTEAGFTRILNAWANNRYNLESVNDAASANLVFNHLLEESDKAGLYVTSGIQGIALEKVVPFLDPVDITMRAVKRLQTIHNYNIVTWKDLDATQFAVLVKGNDFNPGEGIRINKISSDFNEGTFFKPSDGIYCQALWQLDRILDAKIISTDNIVETEISPLLVQRLKNHINTIELRSCSEIGGQLIFKYLERQPWSKEFKNLTPEGNRNLFHKTIAGVNAWLFALSQLEGREGKLFRSQYQYQMMELADQLHIEDMLGGEKESDLDFLFENLSLGDQSLAYKYWKQFQTKNPNGGLHRLREQWDYLRCMEPLSTVEMYLEIWRRFGKEGMDIMIDTWILSQIPLEKRRAIVEGLLKEIDANEHPNDVRYLHEILFTPDEKAGELLSKVKNPSGKYEPTPESIALWLEHTEPTHPLVSLLAKDSDPKLRLLVMGALRAQPTPENVALLNGLLADPDPSVAKAAKEVREYLDKLAAASPMEFSSNPAQLTGEGTGELTVPCE